FIGDRRGQGDPRRPGGGCPTNSVQLPALGKLSVYASAPARLGAARYTSSTHVRSNSETDQAWAIHPPGRCGASPSKTSGSWPAPSFSMKRVNSDNQFAAWLR